jgi:hypothetical protein
MKKKSVISGGFVLKIKYFTIIIFLFSLIFQMSAVDLSSDTSVIDKTQIRKDREKQLNDEINKIKAEIAGNQKELAQTDKKILETANSIIKSINNEEISNLIKDKKDLLLQKIDLEQKIAEQKNLLEANKKELSELRKNFETADGTFNWNYNFDISDKKRYRPGKWNIVVKAVDNDKNESNEEAINVIIDPKSDIPSLNIINPVKNMRVPGNLRVVGTAFDDDAIDKVVLFIDGAKDENICTGKDFWYFDLDTSEMKDGFHSLKVRAYDVNGVSSKDYGVVFQLDRKKPSINVDTIKSGSIVSGFINVGGDASDDNGILSIEYSTDGRMTFEKIPSVKYLNRENTKASWNVKVDSNALKQGIQTIWVKATDKTSSESFYSVTVIIDHTKPVITIDYPKAKSSTGSAFKIMGGIKDNIGVSKLFISYEGNGQKSKFEEVGLNVGNPYWIYPIKLSVQKKSQFTVTAKAVDIAGNISEFSTPITVDPDIDKPVLKLASLKKNDRFTTSLGLSGTIAANDVMKELNVRIINEGSKTPVFEQVYPVTCNYSVDVDISDTEKFADGKYYVELKASNVDGISSDTVKENFIIERTSPSFDGETIKKWAGKAFADRIDLPLAVFKNGGLKNVRYSVFDIRTNSVLVESKVLKFKESKNSGKYDVDNIKEDFSKLRQQGETEKLLGVRIEAEDFINNDTKIIVPVILDFTSPSVSDIAVDPKSGMKEDATLDIKDNLKLKSVLIELTVSGKKVVNSINLSPDELKAGYTGELELKVREADAKSNNEYTLNITARDIAGNETKKSSRIFFTSSEPSSYKIGINVSENENFPGLNDPVVLLDGNDAGLDSFDSTLYCLVPSSLKSFYLVYESQKKDLVPADGDIGIYSYKFSDDEKKSINKLKFEADFFGITSKDAMKKFGVYNFYNDRSYPKLNILWPSGYMYFNNSISIYGTASDDSNELTASYSIDSESNFTDVVFANNGILKTETVCDLDPLKRNNRINLSRYFEANGITVKQDEKLFKINLPLSDLTDGEHYVIIKVRDKSGKEVTRKFTEIFDNAAPELNIWNPKEDEPVNGEITLSGEAKDNFKLADVVLMKNGKEIIANGNYFWDSPYNLNNLNGVDYAKLVVQDIKIGLFAVDFAGNKTNMERNLKLDVSSDMPEVFINSPAEEGQRFTDVVELGGIAVDDDGIKYVQYRIDAQTNGKTDDSVNGVAWERLDMEPGNPNWNKKIQGNDFKSGYHVLEVQAVDLNDLKSKIVKIGFHMDRENPVITINDPANGAYIKGQTVISGKAGDPNGIDTVEISTNYGWSYVKVQGTENWKYDLNTNTVPDGSLRVLIRAKDKAGSDAFSFVLYNVDNKSPELEIMTPKDAGRVNNVFKVEGRVNDNIGIEWVKAAVVLSDDKNKNLEDQFFLVKGNGKGSFAFDVDSKKLDILKRYQAIVRVRDFAGNITEKSVSFYVDPESDIPMVQLDQPQAEQHVTGETIDFYGTAYDDDGIDQVSIKIDDGEEIKANGTVAWNYSYPAVDLTPGIHKVTITAKEKTGANSTGKSSVPIVRSFYYDESGPIIQVLSHVNGEPMEHRPYMTGNVQYYEKNLELKLKKMIQENKLRQLAVKLAKTPDKIPQADQITVSVSEVDSLRSKYLGENKVKSLFLSLDNGKTFEKVQILSSSWKVRVQTQKLDDGVHILQLKAVTANGKENVKYFKVIIDTKKPVVTINMPKENERLNGSINADGTTSDNGKVDNVQISLRQFDKNFNKVPKFIQGLYLWAQFLGGPTVSGGFGFNFFDDVVRLEALFGWTATRANFYASNQDPNNVSALFRQDMNNPRYQPRFSGFAAGGKLLAKILDIPYGYFFGEDARNFSQSIEIGCAFYWFSGYGGTSMETDNSFYQAEKGRKYDPKLDGKLVAGFLYQIDLFKVERFGPFRKFAIYFENAFFFIASEMQGGLFPQFGFGIRNSIF